MSADNGFIKLYRDVRKHWVWDDPEVFRAWVDIIMMANHEDKKIMFNGNLITVKRGSFITSIRKLAERWHWSRGRVSRLLDALERDTMVDTKRDTQKTLIIVVKYGFYQGKKTRNGPRTEPRIEPQTEPQTEPRVEHKQETRRNIKNIKEEKKRNSLSSDDEAGEPWPEGYWESNDDDETDISV